MAVNVRSLRERPLFAALGLREPHGEHTAAEAELLKKHARGARCAVEIGVAEGVSGRQLREVLDPQGTLYLIDPYDRSKLPISLAEIAARRSVRRVRRGDVVWIRKTSHDASAGWREPIDFLFIDGDHSWEAVRQDWDDWTVHVRHGGRVALHDAVARPGLWTKPDDGPVRLVRGVLENGREWEVLETADSTAVLTKVA
jgi:predicted O-methyltransferase YrrM